MVSLSILDLVRVTEDTDAGGALDNARDLAAHAERWGYRRFWVAEHHNMPGIASAATSVVIAHIAAGTEDHPRRCGRHHAAQSCAADHRRAVRHARAAVSRPHRSRARPRAGHRPADGAGAAPRCRRPPTRSRATCSSCRPTSARRSRASAMQAVPAPGTKVPIWILGSSTFGAQLAAELGLPYAFASHFAPDDCSIRARHLPRAFQAVGTARPAATPWSASTSSPRRPTRKRGGSRRRSRCRSRISFAGRAGSASRRSTTSRPIGRRAKRRKLSTCFRVPSSARRQRCAPALGALIGEPQPTSYDRVGCL